MYIFFTSCLQCHIFFDKKGASSFGTEQYGKKITFRGRLCWEGSTWSHGWEEILPPQERNLPCASLLTASPVVPVPRDLSQRPPLAALAQCPPSGAPLCSPWLGPLFLLPLKERGNSGKFVYCSQLSSGVRPATLEKPSLKLKWILSNIAFMKYGDKNLFLLCASWICL